MAKRNFLTTFLTAFFAVCAMTVFGQAATKLEQTPAKEQVQQTTQKAQMQATLQMRQNLRTKLEAGKSLNWTELSSTNKESYEFWKKVDQSALTIEEKKYVNNILEGMKEKLQNIGH